MTPEPLSSLTVQAHNFTVDNWVYSGARDEYDADAPYQRGNVWTVAQRQNLIKSLLLNLPVGSIIYADLDRDFAPGFRIVDGKQRFTTVRMFVDDEFPVPAWWFHADDLTNPDAREHPESNVFFSGLKHPARRTFRSRPLPGIEFQVHHEVSLKPDGHGVGSDRYNFRRRSESEMLQAEAELYLLVNFGGVPQSDTDRARAQEVADQ